MNVNKLDPAKGDTSDDGDEEDKKGTKFQNQVFQDFAKKKVAICTMAYKFLNSVCKQNNLK